jgi:hypothetical protein
MRITLESEAFFDFIRLDSLWIETSPLLVQQVVGEVARFDQPDPERGFAEVALGEMTDFTYDLRAEFGAASQGGFDALRIHTGSRPQFKYLQMGDPLGVVEPEQVIEGANELVIHLPQRVTRANSQPLRVVFGAEVFVFANTFTGEVFDTRSERLPQQVEAGDASQAVSTDNLRVLGDSGEHGGEIIENLVFTTGAVTPNGDGINDLLTIDYALFRLPSPIPVELNIYALQGTRVGQIDLGLQSAGPQQVQWDGSDGLGQVLPPGLYLLEIALRAEFKTFRHIRPVAVVY